jgi:hypothetical protein
MDAVERLAKVAEFDPPPALLDPSLRRRRGQWVTPVRYLRTEVTQ